MTRTILTAAFALFSMGAVLHAASAADANGDGVLTIDEVQAVMPEVTAEAFNEMDANADGALDEAEVQSAQEAGLMPA